MSSKKLEQITKKIRLDHDGGITIFYGEKEKFGKCIYNIKEFCGVWCPLFPVPSDFGTSVGSRGDKRWFLKFVCHGYEQGIYVEVKM
jgi:hypothetical protein